MLASHGVIDEKAEAITLSEGVQLLIAGDVSSTQRELLTGVAAQLVVVLKQRTLEVEAAQTKLLEQADALRTALLAAVSHDLRTPLASIKAATTTLLAARGKISDADTEELLRGIDVESDRLNGLVCDLLDMSRIQEGAVLCVRKVVDLTDVVSLALDEVARVTHGAGRVAVVAPETLTMTTDPMLVERIIANLARNAVEHGNSTEVTVVLEELGSQVLVRVVDRGPGIALERRERVWGPIQRAGDVANGKGVGLGLAIAKGLTTVLGGTLDIDETPGGGCTMVLTLPRLP
jgi:two-component system sensor histidine kinase KdpD